MANANKMVQALVVDIMPQIKGSAETVRSVQKFAEKTANEISKVLDKVGRAAFDTADIKNLAEKMKDMGQSLQKARQEGNKEAENAIQDQFRQEKTNLEKLLKRRAEGQKFAEGALTKPEKAAAIGQTIGEGVGAAFHDVISGDIGNIGNMLKRWGGRTKKVGFAMQAKEGQKSAGGILGIVGKILRKLGPTLLVVGSIAAALTTIVKVAIDADTRMKELTQTLIDSGAAVGDIVSSSRSLRSVLYEMAKFAQNQPFNEMWGTLPKDQVQILGAWSEAGFTLKEMRTQIKGAGSDMAAYRKATAAALTYSKLLGESAASVAQGMAERMEDLGLSLKGVQEQYASVYDAAQLSGFGTKRFFGMVLQATSGMTMFNVRMDEAAGLMLSFTKILGRKSGEEFFQTMNKGFKDMSLQNRVKAVKLMGDQFKEIAAKEMSKAGTDVMGKLSSDFGKDFNRGAEALAAFGMDMGMSQKLLKKIAAGGPAARAAQKQLGDIFTESMVKMTPKEYTKALAEARLHIDDAKMITEIEKLYSTTRGMSDNIVEQARAAASWGPGGVMAGQLAIVMNKFNKPLEEITGKDLLAVQELTGLSEDEAENMARVLRTASGGFNKLESIQQSGQKITGKLNKELADKYGMAFKDGKKYSAILKDGNIIFKDEINNVQDAIMAMGGAVANIPNAEKDHRKQALEIAQETLDVEKRIQQHVEQLLGEISRKITRIHAALTGGLTNKEEKNRKDVVNILKTREKELEAQKKGKTPEEQAKLDAEKKAANLLRRRMSQAEKLKGGLVSNKGRVELAKESAKVLIDALKRPSVSVQSSMMATKFGYTRPPAYTPVGEEQFKTMREIADVMLTKAEVATIMKTAKTAGDKLKAERMEAAKERLKGATKEEQNRTIANISSKAFAESRKVASEEFFKVFRKKGVAKFLEEALKAAVEGSAQKARAESKENYEKLFGTGKTASAGGPPNIDFHIYGDEQSSYRGTTKALDNIVGLA